jgi:hypothetical protein
VIVVGVRLATDENDVLTVLGPLRRVVGCEHGSADGRSRRRIEASSYRILGILEVGADDWLEELV